MAGPRPPRSRRPKWRRRRARSPGRSGRRRGGLASPSSFLWGPYLDLVCMYIYIQLHIYIYTWTSKRAKIMDPILPLLSILGYWANILGSFGGSGIYIYMYVCIYTYTYLYPTWMKQVCNSWPLGLFLNKSWAIVLRSLGVYVVGAPGVQVSKYDGTRSRKPLWVLCIFGLGNWTLQVL